ncbi:MAG: hypothetical protein R2712_17305 [Vicinamibacterales bacterium]
MLPGQQLGKRVVRADYLLVQAGQGAAGCRSVTSSRSTARTCASRTIASSVCSGRATRTPSISPPNCTASRKQDVGNVARTINIPMLGMMLLHPDVRERFAFKHDGDEQVSGR